MIHFALTYAEAALIAVSIALVLMVVAYLRNDSRWCDKYNALLTGCRVDHQGWTMQRSGILRGMAIPPPPPMPPQREYPVLRCAEPGCEENRVAGSNYCSSHRLVIPR